MNIAAYCRVSTEKEDQLNSLEAQKAFFAEYTKKTGDTLVRLYADEGISGTKIKNRKEFLKMMSDAMTFHRTKRDILFRVRFLRCLCVYTTKSKL